MFYSVVLELSRFITSFFNFFRVLVEQHDENLGTLIKFIIYNELSQARNPNNMSLFAVLFQYASGKAAKVQ